jgi:hypothetical protein
MSSEGRVKLGDAETIIDNMLRKHNGDIAQEIIEDTRRNVYRSFGLVLPDREDIALVELLITDRRMKDVWSALGRRVAHDDEFIWFFMACKRGKEGWRSYHKQTSAERKSFY